LLMSIAILSHVFEVQLSGPSLGDKTNEGSQPQNLDL
jgi:hypothetical protein